jgi:hypothetical protein
MISIFHQALRQAIANARYFQVPFYIQRRINQGWDIQINPFHDCYRVTPEGNIFKEEWNITLSENSSSNVYTCQHSECCPEHEQYLSENMEPDDTNRRDPFIGTKLDYHKGRRPKESEYQSQ